MATRRDIRPGVFTINGLLSRDECAAFISKAEAVGFAEAPITTAFGPVMNPGVRNNTRVMLDDLDGAAALWERARPFLPATIEGEAAVGFNERFRYYCYDPGQIFKWHYDGAYERECGEISRLTFMIYLNEGFEGGATEFTDFDVTPKTGLALVFLHRQLHQGGEVLAGRKYVLRTDVMYRGA